MERGRGRGQNLFFSSFCFSKYHISQVYFEKNNFSKYIFFLMRAMNIF